MSWDQDEHQSILNIIVLEYKAGVTVAIHRWN